jgi:hypothetical protein
MASKVLKPRSGVFLAAGPGLLTWTDASKICDTGDDNYAYCLMETGQFSKYLQALDYGAAIPADATVNSVSFDVLLKGDGTVTDYAVYLCVDGQPAGSDVKQVPDWPQGLFGHRTYSGPWGVALTPTTVNSALFGLCIAAQGPTGMRATVDSVVMTITYTPSGGGNPTPENAIWYGTAL